VTASDYTLECTLSPEQCALIFDSSSLSVSTTEAYENERKHIVPMLNGDTEEPLHEEGNLNIKGLRMRNNMTNLLESYLG